MYADEKKNKITSDCISFSPSFYFSPLVSHCHIRMRGALIEKRVWKNLSHRWNIIMYNSCHCLVLSTNMISMKIYHCHVLPLRARSNHNVISLICSTNEFSRCVFVCAYLFVSFIFDLISYFNETLCPNSNLPNNHMLTFSYHVYNVHSVTIFIYFDWYIMWKLPDRFGLFSFRLFAFYVRRFVQCSVSIKMKCNLDAFKQLIYENNGNFFPPH